jgi:hypothetical protein
VVDKDPGLITVRRSTVVRVGVVALVLVALGVGTAIGLLVGSRSSPSTKSSTTGTQGGSASTTSLPQTSTTGAPLPVVLSCGPSSTRHLQPTTITVGCATGTTTVTGISWNEWGAATGGQGTGTLKVGSQSTQAIVIVFHVVDGVFQDLSVTPSNDVSSTTSSATSRTTLPVTTTAPGGLTSVAASQPGSGWGGS